MKLYKLTDEKMRTQGYYQWVIGQKAELPPKDNPEICSGDVFHAYTDANLALLLNPLHGFIREPRLFLAEGEPVVHAWDKVGTFGLTLSAEMPIPEWYINKKLRRRAQISFAILCAEAVLAIWEQSYPSDNSPQKAIEAAKAYLTNPNTVTANAASYAAHTATLAAAHAADCAGAHAAGYAAAHGALAACAACAAQDAALGAAHGALAASTSPGVTIAFAKLAAKAITGC